MKPEYYGSYLSGSNGDKNRQWIVMYRYRGCMYDRAFNQCPFSIKRQIALKKTFR